MIGAFATIAWALASSVIETATLEDIGRAPIELETATLLPTQWEDIGRAPPHANLELTFAVKQTRVPLLKEFVLRASDPDHVSYGHWLSLQEVNAFISPTKQAVISVSDYLRSFGVNTFETTSNNDFIKSIVRVDQAELLLDTEFRLFQHVSTNRTVVRTLGPYSLPTQVAAHVDFVAPTVRFPRISARLHNGVEPLPSNSKASDAVTPSVLRQFYQVGDVEGTFGKQAFPGFLEQYWAQSDLDAYWTKFYPKATGRIISVRGLNNQTDLGIEATTDVQYLSAMGGGVPTEFWSFPGRAPDPSGKEPDNEPFLDWLFAVSNTSDADVPKVFSTSYADSEFIVSAAYANRVDTEFVKAAARGISMLFGSGDTGVSHDGSCPRDGQFSGQWPAGSPWTTGVGGTAGGFPGSYEKTERVWEGSGGGFSNFWPRPAYQTAAVATYFATVPKRKLPVGHYNATGAGFPDVAAQANNYQVVRFGRTVPVAGTSCACPTFAGIVSLLNSARLAANKSTLGFLNPLFYKNAGVFNDVTSGANEAGAGCGNIGFSAQVGWDPVTGLGTPNYPKLLELVNSLP
jgi:tripeptidyl-peptidase-1